MINYTEQEVDYFTKVANSDVGYELVRILEKIEAHYADIRNLNGVPAEVRIDALKLLREALLDKLLVLSGKLEKPDNDEFR